MEFFGLVDLDYNSDDLWNDLFMWKKKRKYYFVVEENNP
jgi:hypothetical protein